MMTRDELIDTIIELSVELRKAKIPRGNCPYAYYTDIKQEGDCENCSQCKYDFFKKYRENLEAHFANERGEG